MVETLFVVSRVEFNCCSAVSPKMFSQRSDTYANRVERGARPKTNSGTYANRFSVLDPDSETNKWQVQDRNKRRRRSTGGSFGPSQALESGHLTSEYQTMSKSKFKELSTDDKLVTMFEAITDIGSLNGRILNIESDMQKLQSRNLDHERRIKLVEYKSIDLEARSRRNNLIFRGHPESVENDDCFKIIRQFLAEKLEINPDVCIQRAHRLGYLNRRRRDRWGRQASLNQPRSIIVNFRDYQDVELILSNAKKLKDTPFGINRDYPKEIISARSNLWPKYKKAKADNPNGNVYIGYPAKLIVNGKVVADEFPEWNNVLKGSRVQEKTNSIGSPNSKSSPSFVPTQASQETENVQPEMPEAMDLVASMVSDMSRSSSRSVSPIRHTEINEKVTKVETAKSAENLDEPKQRSNEGSGNKVPEPSKVMNSDSNEGNKTDCSVESATNKLAAIDSEMKRLFDSVKDVRRTRARQTGRSSSESRVQREK